MAVRVRLVLGLSALVLVGVGAGSKLRGGSGAGIHKIRHVVIVMQENRSFDSYFGTYPGADGIPMQNGVPTVCVPDPLTGVCVRPYHDRTDRDGGGMDGFIAQEQRGRSFACDGLQDPRCTIAVAANEPDVMG